MNGSEQHICNNNEFRMVLIYSVENGFINPAILQSTESKLKLDEFGT